MKRRPVGKQRRVSKQISTKVHVVSRAARAVRARAKSLLTLERRLVAPLGVTLLTNKSMSASMRRLRRDQCRPPVRYETGQHTNKGERRPAG